jgi:protein-S-isoprenylcysteine O-methyltransferase Ste14
MRAPEPGDGKPSSRISIPRWMAPIVGLFGLLVAIPLAHGGIPWALSLLTPRYGWTGGRPGGWNLLGVILLVVGAAGLVWVLVLGLAQTRNLPERVGLDWTPKLLLMRGPYAFSRNPMYVAEAALWLGWAILFGSTAVLIGFLVLCVAVNIIARHEEPALEAQFGETYLQYKAVVPRWLGKPQR